MSFFIKSAKDEKDWINDDKLEIAFIGRSNSGKSSLINALANKKIAISSKKQGCTKLVNFYNFGKFRIIDLPGYGYAKQSKKNQISLLNIISSILVERKNLYAIYQVVDSNVLSNEDAQVNKYLKSKFVNVYVCLNKSDKMPLKRYVNSLKKITKFLGVKNDEIIFTSAKNGINIKYLFSHMKKIINEVI